MDFRSTAPESLSFRPRVVPGGRRGRVATARGGGGPALAVTTADGGKVRVQLPRASCVVGVHSPGVYRVDLRFPPSEIGEALEEWTRRVEEHAAGSVEATGGLTRSSTLFWNGRHYCQRVLAFHDTPVFDAASGEMSADLPSARSAIALVELVGVWTTEARWGLRWKLVQLKFWRDDPVDDALERDVKRRRRVDDDAGGEGTDEACMFGRVA